jgi:hypothetical protein
MPNPQPTPPTSSTPAQALAQLKKYYFDLNDNFATLVGQCTTDDQRNQVKNEFVVARDAYLKAQNQVLIDHDNTLAAMTKQLGDLQKQIDNAISSAEQIAKILQILATASGVAAKIVTTAT